MEQSKVDAAIVRKTLREIVASETFLRSPQLIDFLKYVVEARLVGDEARIKAYSIAVDVFGRSEDFDPQYDSIVRVQARRLRELLAQFYVESNDENLIRINLPVGRYIPEFSAIANENAVGASDRVRSDPSLQRRNASQTAPDDGATTGNPADTDNTWRRFGYMIALFAVPALVALFTLFAVSFSSNWTGQKATIAGDEVLEPVVAISNFINQTDDANAASAVDDLKLAVASDLALFDNAVVRIDVGQTIFEPGANRGQFFMSGVVRRNDDKLMASFLVTKGNVAEVVWTRTIEQQLTGNDYAAALKRAAQQVASELGSLRGPLHALGNDMLPRTFKDLINPSVYVCRLLYDRSLGRTDTETRQLASDCLNKVKAAQGTTPVIEVALAEIEAEELIRSATPGESLQERLFDVTAIARTAAIDAPNNSFVLTTLGHVLRIQGAVEPAREAFNMALVRNPANTHALAGLGVTLAFNGLWEEGAKASNAAIGVISVAPAWFFLVPSLDALRKGDYNHALEYAQKTVSDNPNLSAMIGTAAAVHIGRNDLMVRYRQMMLNSPFYQKFGLMPRTRQWITDQRLLDIFEGSMLLAGVTPAQLEGPYEMPETAPED